MEENGNVRDDQMPFNVRVKTAWENFRRHFKSQDCSKRPEKRCFPMTPTEVIAHYGKNLSGLEIDEIIDFPKIWYLGQNAMKLHPSSCSVAVSLGDHIGYRYEVLEYLGHGTYGQVFSCLDHKTNEMVAVKVINYYYHSLEEVKILEFLRMKDGDNSFNVIHMKECFYFREKLCIVFELMGLNLFGFMRSAAFEAFNATIVRHIARDLLKGLTLLEQEKLIHADLKPDNITFAKDGRVKLIDFGFSFFENKSRFTNIQALGYRSPEVILRKPYSTAIDMWSLGCILVELYTGKALFTGENVPDQLACIMEVLGIPPDDCFRDSLKKAHFFDSNGQPRVSTNRRGKKRKPGSRDLAAILQTDDEQFLDFIKRCLTWDPKDRLTASEAIEHDWLNQDNFINTEEKQEQQSEGTSECFVESLHIDTEDSETIDFDQEIESSAEQVQTETSVERCSSKQGVYRKVWQVLCPKQEHQ